MSRRLSTAIFACAVACSRRAPPPPPEPALDAAPAPAAPPVSIAPATRPAAPKRPSYAETWFAGRDEASYRAAFVGGAPKAAKSIGHTSVVFRLDLATGERCAFKPASRKSAVRWRGEIAAYALGRALDLLSVPPAFERTVPASALGSDEVPEGGGGIVRGAAMPWIDRLVTPPLEAEPLASRWKSWLAKGAAIPDEPVTLADGAVARDARDLARQMSDLVVFDHLTGNWDRWSGGNIGYRQDAELVLFIDNDGAFFERPPEDALARSERMLAGVDRFSRSLVERLDTLSIDDVAARAHLSAAAADGVRARLARVRALVAEKKKVNGETETLYFP